MPFDPCRPAADPQCHIPAAKTVKEAGKPRWLPGRGSRVSGYRHQHGTARAPAQSRAEMGDGMALFCSGLAGHFFNRPGQSGRVTISKWACWPEG